MSSHPYLSSSLADKSWSRYHFEMNECCIFDYLKDSNHHLFWDEWSATPIKHLHLICFKDVDNILSIISLLCIDRCKLIGGQSFNKWIMSSRPPNQMRFVSNGRYTSFLYDSCFLMTHLYLIFMMISPKCLI